jgi:hypothetical protein
MTTLKPQIQKQDFIPQKRAFFIISEYRHDTLTSGVTIKEEQNK